MRSASGRFTFSHRIILLFSKPKNETLGVYCDKNDVQIDLFYESISKWALLSLWN